MTLRVDAATVRSVVGRLPHTSIPSLPRSGPLALESPSLRRLPLPHGARRLLPNLPVDNDWSPVNRGDRRLPRARMIATEETAADPGNVAAPPAESNTPTPPAAPRQPRGVPVVHSHPAHVRGVTLTERGITLMPSLDNLIAELRAANLYIRPSGQIGHAPKVNEHPKDSAQVTSYGFIGSVGTYVPHQNIFATTYLDGTSTQLVLSRTVDGLSMGLSGQLWDGWFTAIYTNTFNVGHELFNVGAQVQLWRDKARLGFAFVNTNLTTNTFIAAGGFVGLYANASMVDVGEYVGPDAEELAQAHAIDYAAEGMHRIEVKRASTLAWSVRGGAGMFWLAGLARVDGLRTKSRTYRTMASRQRTHDLVFEGTGLRQYFKDRFRALGWVQDIIDIPDAHQPESLRLGDEVVENKSGTWMLDLLVGNLTVWAGVQFLFRGDTEISTHRLDDTRYEVVFNPTRLRDSSIYIFSPFGPEIDGGRGRATSFRQAYIFDISKPEALEAYHQALEGKLPTQRHTFVPNDATFKGDQQLAALVNEQNAELPEGVKRLYVHAVTTEETRRGGGAHFGIIPKDILPHGWTNTWATHHTFAHERQSITNGDIVDYANAYSTEHRRELLWCGLNSDEISAQQRWSQDNDTPRSFTGLTLECSLLRSCVRGSLHNGNTIDLLNNSLGTHLKHFERPGHKQQREVDISRVLNGETLEQLEAYAQLWSGGMSFAPLQEVRLWTDITRAAKGAQISIGAVGSMLRNMAAAPNLKKKTEAVQCFVQAHGMAAFGLLHRLLPEGSDSPLQITSISSSYINALRTEARLRLYYLQPIAASDTPAQLRERLKKIEAGQHSLRNALLDLADDPLINPAERPILRDHLLAAQQRLYDLAAVRDADRPVLEQTLEASHAWQNEQMRGQLRYLSNVAALAAHGEAWARAYAGVPMPQDIDGLRARWEALYPVAMELHDRLMWLRTQPPLLSDAACAALRTQVERALGHLVGQDSGFPERPPHGVLDLTELDASSLRALRHAGLHTWTSRQEAALAGYLKQLRG